MKEKEFRDFRASGIAAVTAVLCAAAMDALQVPYPYLVIVFFVVLFTTGHLVHSNDKREAEWQKKIDEKARELEAKRLHEEGE